MRPWNPDDEFKHQSCEILLAFVFSLSPSASRVGEQVRCMPTCQSYRSSDRNNSQAVTIDSYSPMSLVKLLRSISPLCRFRLIFGDISSVKNFFATPVLLFVISTFILLSLLLPSGHWSYIRIHQSELDFSTLLQRNTTAKKENGWENYTCITLLILLQIYVLWQIQTITIHIYSTSCQIRISTAKNYRAYYIFFK